MTSTKEVGHTTLLSSSSKGDVAESKVKTSLQSYANTLRQSVESAPFPKDFQSLAEKAKALASFKVSTIKTTLAAQTVIPYYADYTVNRYSLLGDPKAKSIDQEDPYNLTVAFEARNETKGVIDYFEDKSLKPASRPILLDVAAIIGKILSREYLPSVEQNTSESASIFKYMYRHTCNLIYREQYGFMPLVPQSTVQNFLKNKGQISRNGFKTYRQLLADEINSLRTDSDSRMGYAYILALEKTFKDCYSNEDHRAFFSQFLQKHKDYTPTFHMLRIVGTVPDCNLTRYKSLYFQKEWEIILSQRITNAEAIVNELSVKKLTQDNLSEVFLRLSQVRTSLKDSKVFEEVKRLKGLRLGVASDHKRSRARDSLGASVGKQWHQKPRLQEVYNPFSLAILSGLLKDSNPIYMSGLSWKDDSALFVYDVPKIVHEEEVPIVLAIGTEFASWLST
jgi:hypothetical protein